MYEYDVKPGWQTSEFWTLVVTSVVNVLAMAGIFTPKESSDLAQIIPVLSGGIGQAIIIAGYAISRSKAKGK